MEALVGARRYEEAIVMARTVVEYDGSHAAKKALRTRIIRAGGDASRFPFLQD